MPHKILSLSSHLTKFTVFAIYFLEMNFFSYFLSFALLFLFSLCLKFNYLNTIRSKRNFDVVWRRTSLLWKISNQIYLLNFTWWSLNWVLLLYSVTSLLKLTLFFLGDKGFAIGSMLYFNLSLWFVMRSNIVHTSIRDKSSLMINLVSFISISFMNFTTLEY